ncbi:DNA repair protein RecN [Flavobacterium caeni]|uniref:DNA repair protein RecN n=1 Tax=Flavobacterium caeni TaxID=490189 RepID=A0A1G5BFE6_9FLAO|nr:DNA repair protein RecN [Flavobacterium caeni]SCX88859.1 DNA repair protein RecN (Recombination protein N) [Flavobacterium caeni]
MITALSIHNFALIEKLAIDFSGGFSIITGETGAGKSILLGALGLVLGKRADLGSLKNKDEKCVIEAQFSIANYQLQTFFEVNDLDYEDQTIIRREILPSGKSRAFVNDTPVNLQELQQLGDLLIDIHSQHQTQELSEDDFQFRIIDAMAQNKDLIAKYTTLLKSYKKDQSSLSELQSTLQNSIKEQDYHSFLLEELLAANLKPDEQQTLESTYEQLSNVESIREQLEKSLAAANEEQFGVSANLREIKNALQKIAGFSSDYQSLSERLNSVAIEFDDIASELHRMGERLVQDPQELDRVNQKLQAIYHLQKKHNVATVAELLAIQNDLDQKAVSLTTLENDIAGLQQRMGESEQKLDAFANQIHNNRIAAIPDLTGQWGEILAHLGMPNVRFQIDIKPVSNYLAHGKDELQFLFSANKGSDFGLLKKVASGGELSRIMLATKSILAQYAKLPTIIFDEIDTGVSGEIADKMGEIMRGMSKQMQVFAITHLPQIAAKGDDHFKVFKTSDDAQTQTRLKRLDREQRVMEIAQMLSGSALSDSAINHAKALLD